VIKLCKHEGLTHALQRGFGDTMRHAVLYTVCGRGFWTRARHRDSRRRRYPNAFRYIYANYQMLKSKKITRSGTPTCLFCQEAMGRGKT
jgi:hypothetical protein